MEHITYKFDLVKYRKHTNYIFQTISGRKLTDIYHDHDFYEWLVVLSGSCTHLVNGKEYEMPENTCCLLCPGDMHTFTGQTEHLLLLALSVSKEETAKMKAFYRSEPLTFFTAPVPRAQELSVFLQATQEYEYKTLLANLFRIYMEVPHTDANMPYALQYAMREMEKPENLRQGVSRMTALSGYSRSQLSRMIERHCGTTLQAYLFNLKMETAYQRLMLTGICTEELAEELGYASFSHFHQAFKKKYGITPAQLRKKHGVWTT